MYEMSRKLEPLASTGGLGVKKKPLKRKKKRPTESAPCVRLLPSVGEQDQPQYDVTVRLSSDPMWKTLVCERVV
jgi:hypothetical protein